MIQKDYGNSRDNIDRKSHGDLTMVLTITEEEFIGMRSHLD